MRDRKGFTLIELLIVVVIIGILAAIAIPKFSATREKAYFSAMKSDLKNLMSQQEIYYSDEYAYTQVLEDLGFTPSSGVTVTVEGADAQGYRAIAVHAAMTGEGCGVKYGAGAGETDPSIGGGDSGAIVCTDTEPAAAP